MSKINKSMRAQFRDYKKQREIEKHEQKKHGSIVPNKIEQEAIRKFREKEKDNVDYDYEATQWIIRENQHRSRSTDTLEYESAL